MEIFIAVAATVLVSGTLFILYFRPQSKALETCRAEREQLKVELSALSEKYVELQRRHAALEAASAERIAALSETQSLISKQFKALSDEALRQNNMAFLELAKHTLEHFHERAKTDLSTRQEAIDMLVKPLRESLQKVDAKIVELEKNRVEGHGKLTQQLEQLSKTQLYLQNETNRLSTALRSNTTVGSWGELQLRRVVELADMLPYCDFIEQKNLVDYSSSTRIRPDLIVRLPGRQQIAIDAKTPIQSYRAAMESQEENTRKNLLLEHARSIRKHVNELSVKNYWEQITPTPEFVVLFIPGEHYLSAALQTDASLLEYAIQRKILLASPITLIALLKAAAYGWRQEALAQNSQEIANVGRELYKRVNKLTEHLEKIGRSLESAARSYNSAIGSCERMLIPATRQLAELGAKGDKEPSLTLIGEMPRIPDSGES